MARTSLLILTALVMLSGTSIAHAINNEVVCTQSGYTMDPRCEGR